MTRIDSVSAATVAIRSSGQMMVVMTDAGTTMPPIPRPATTRIPYTAGRLSRVAAAMAPVPTVIITEEPIMRARLLPRKMDSSQRTTQAPIRMEKPTGSPRSVAIDVNCLGRPEEDNGEEVGA